ncbi:MAG: hypothetical protein AAF253_03480 [Pseudomonadota bacterium]
MDDTPSEPPNTPSPGRAPAATRDSRLSQALRDNLKRRKAAQRKAGSPGPAVERPPGDRD